MNDRIVTSVVIPTFNNERTIGAAVESALGQRYERPFEVIVVNDGSTDGTRGVLATFGDRIRVIDQENRGVAAARNAGARAAKGDFIALLDGDDTWTEDRLAKTVPVMERDAECVVVFADAIQVDSRGTVVIPFFVSPEDSHSPAFDEMLDHAWTILPSSVVMRRSTLLEVGGFPEAFGACGYGGEDVSTMLKMRERGKVVYVPEKVVRYTLADFEGNLVKRFRDDANGLREGGGPADPDSLFSGCAVFRRLVHERYGARGRALIKQSMRSQGLGLIGIGMMAIHRGDRAGARRCYRASLRYAPLELKTYLRLAWASLPAPIAKALVAMLTPRIRRSLNGPPFHILQRP